LDFSISYWSPADFSILLPCSEQSFGDPHGWIIQIYFDGQSLIPEVESDELSSSSSPAGMASAGASSLVLLIAGAKVKSYGSSCCSFIACTTSAGMSSRSTKKIY